MAFPTLIATVGGASSNTYATELEADTWLEFRLGASAWANFSEELKAQALVTATRDLDTLTFIGTKASSTQALEWPRSSTSYSADTLPAALVRATIELAFVYASELTADATLDVLNPAAETGNIKRETAGPVETEYFASTSVAATALERFPAVVQRLLTPLVRAITSTAWGSSLATRGS